MLHYSAAKMDSVANIKWMKIKKLQNGDPNYAVRAQD